LRETNLAGVFKRGVSPSFINLFPLSFEERGKRG